MDQLPENDESTGSGALAVIVDSIGTFFGKVPAALQHNVTKAFGHMLKVPNAYIDGLAAEIKANSEARVKIAKATGNKLAQAVEVDSSLAAIATHTHARKILRQQTNAIKVLKHTADELGSATSGQNIGQTKKISDDWLNAFESEAVNMSSDQMQRLFGKMLAGEIRRPSTFSVRTVKLMGQMDINVAQLFRKFCSMVSSYQVGEDDVVIDGRVISLGDESHTALSGFGLNHFDILELEEYGLIANSVPTYFTYRPSIYREVDSDPLRIPISYNNRLYALIPEPPKTSDDYAKYGTIGIALSRVGRELLKVVDLEENLGYTNALTIYFKDQGLELFEFSD